ncbi:Cytochrome c heme lyase subunit CcmI, apocytochrome c chaperone [hydrothermal vent metagenome]|uniref:Cytochrome c heme lyase subunit CcmI, apocytochrome c chaperone n=1 Tax=hydrothermal vent metagenome TaxID=652676 RepID=A0A3B0T2X3_9ZZZZ
MLFWIIISALALSVAALLGLALIRGRVGDAPPAAYDLQVYRDQLREVERDLARGVIGAGEAERIRAEVSRRVLSADAQLKSGGETGGQPRWAGWVMAAICALLLGGGSVLLYSFTGQPGFGDQPQANRIAAAEEARTNRLSQTEAEELLPTRAPAPQVSEDFLNLMDRLRKTVKARPDDLQGLALLARNEAALGNIIAAYKAQQQLIGVKDAQATADDYAFLTDLLVSAANGYISTDARTAMRAALAHTPDQPTARYYLGLYLWQVGRPDAAFRMWEKLLRDGPPDAPWTLLIRQQIEELAWLAGVRYTLPPAEDQPGPTADQVESAQDMSQGDRVKMIQGMVSRLSQRLSTEGGSAADWARLIGAYGVLDETDKARTIWQEAQQVFADRPNDLAQIRANAEKAGVAK